MKWYEAIAEMHKDESKEFIANGWKWKVTEGVLSAVKPDDTYGTKVDYSNVDINDQRADWTLVIPPPKEYTFKEMVTQLLKLGKGYYGQCTDQCVDTTKFTAYGRFIRADNKDRDFVHRYLLEDDLRYHIKPKE